MNSNELARAAQTLADLDRKVAKAKTDMVDLVELLPTNFFDDGSEHADLVALILNMKQNIDSL
jgi:hypothetical protein